MAAAKIGATRNWCNPEMYLCPYCGVKLADQVRFCSQCGGPIAWDAPEPATETARPVEPTPTASARTAWEGAGELPVPENIAGAISYATIVPAAVFLLVEPFRHNRFVRFHAMQYLLLFVAAVAAFVAASILWMLLELIPFMRVLVFPFVGLISLAWFFLWLLLVVKAYQHEMFKLPWIGAYAEEWSLK